MKKNRLLIPFLLIFGLSTSACAALFNDDDISIYNSYNPATTSVELDSDAVTAGGVEGKEIAAVNEAYCFKNINYAPDGFIPNTYKAGGVNYNGFVVNNNEDYPASETSNVYDLYVPETASRTDKHLVILFIHGGAWVSGFKTDVNPYVYEFANRGYITATIKYTLLNRQMNNNTLSIFRDLDEIDACIASIKSILGDLGFNTNYTQLVIGGASSGAHLSMLYSYSRGVRCPLPIQFIVDAVGPVDIKPDCWKSFINSNDEVLDAGITHSAIAAQNAAGNLRELPIAGEGVNWNEYQTMRIANGMCGIPYPVEEVKQAGDSAGQTIANPNEASLAMTEPGGGEDLLSVTYWMATADHYPIICAYAGKDSIVGIAQYAKLEKYMDANSVYHKFYYFKNGDHTDISKEKDETTYNAFVNEIDSWCRAIV